MEAGEGLFPLSSGFNSALLGYHIAKLLRGNFSYFGQDACFTSTVMDEKPRCLSDGATGQATLMDGDRGDIKGLGILHAPLCRLTCSNSD